MKHLFSLSSLVAGLSAIPAVAQDALSPQGLEVVGRPEQGGVNFQPAVTSLASDQQWLDWMILIIITGIVFFVTALIVYVIFRYSKSRNPTPASFTHNTPIEIAWTFIPILILVAIGAWSLPVLFSQQEIPKADVTIKAIGNQWYWSYEYVDEEFGFDSYMIGAAATLSDEELAAGAIPNAMNDITRKKLIEAGYAEDEFLLATDTAVVVPVGKTIVMQVTASDVIHSWTIPSFGVKQDGVPGRLAELWFKAEREGVYFGQCSELCGELHSYMPITVKVVSEAAYQEWLGAAKAEYAGIPQAISVASR